MLPDSQSPKSDIVSSIFSRKGKRRLSSLFGHRQAKISGQAAIKKIFPFGLDIGTSSIKLVQLGCDSEGTIKIINTLIEELPKEAQGYDSKERKQILTQILKNALENKGLKGDCFVVAPHPFIKVNLIKLPPMPANEIDKAVYWEIKQSSKVDLQELSFDYIILEKQKIRFLGNQIGVLAITAPKKDMFEYLELLESAGLAPQAIDIEPLADLALLNYAKEVSSGSEVVLWLDFGAGKTSLNIICNNELISLRDLNVTGNSLTKAISGYCHLSWEEAEFLKKNFSLSADEVGGVFENTSEKALQVRSAIFPLFENMIQDIEYTFKYFSYQVTQSQITRFDKIILSGGLSCIKGLLPFLQSCLNVEVISVGSLVNFESLDETHQASDVFNPRLSVALGLALRGVE